METIAGNVLVACTRRAAPRAAVTLTLACAGWRGCGSMFRSLVRDETGGSYMAGAVMVFPMKIMLIAIVVELTMLLIALGGTFYASYVTARSAVVWLSAAPGARDRADPSRGRPGDGAAGVERCPLPWTIGPGRGAGRAGVYRRVPPLQPQWAARRPLSREQVPLRH